MNILKQDEHGKTTEKSDHDLKGEHLDVKLNESEPGSRLERLPGLDKDRAASATGLEVELAEDSAAVEGNDGLLVLREESGFNTGQGDGGGKKDRKSDEDAGQRDGEQGKGVVCSVGRRDITVHEVELSVVHLFRETESKGHSNRHHEGDLLSDGKGESREKDSLAVLAGDHAAEPGLAGGCRNHAVSPDHVNAGKTDG